MEEKKENIKGPVPRLYSNDNAIVPKKVIFRVGSNLASGRTFESSQEDRTYKDIPVNNILIKNKDNHYADFFDAQDFVSTSLMTLPMLLRKCWQPERQALKSKNTRGKPDVPNAGSSSSLNSLSNNNNTASGPPPKIARNS